MGTQFPLPQKGTAPPSEFSVHICCGQMAGWIKMPGLSPSDIVLDGDPAPPPPKGGGAPSSRSMSIVARRLDGSKMPLGMKVGLGPGHIVLDGDPSPLLQRGTAPIFGQYLLWPNGWMDQDATWQGGKPQPRSHYVRMGPSFPRESGTAALPLFSAHLYCGHGRPFQLLLSSCTNGRSKISTTVRLKVLCNV